MIGIIARLPQSLFQELISRMTDKTGGLVMSVSYTHLILPPYPLNTFSILTPLFWATIRASRISLNAKIVAFTKLCGLEAVSYTHLDVYKRQEVTGVYV